MLLAQSVLGGITWPGAERWLCRLTYGDVQQIVKSTLIGQSFMIEVRKGIQYPIYIHESVTLALLTLITQVMAQNPLRNRGLRPIPADTPLAPIGKPARSARLQMKYQLRLIDDYLSHAADTAGLKHRPTLFEFQATTRWLLTRIYPLDAIYALLGAVDVTAPPTSQLIDPGPKRLLDQLSQSMQGRGHA